MWYERARVASDGTASLAAIEQLANLKVRRACEDVTVLNSNNRAAQQKARREITEAMALMDTLLSVGATVEREGLYGSAYKRLALIEAAAGREDEEIKAISRMRDHYNAAERIARSDAANEKVNLYYPVMNRIAAQLALEGGTRRVSARDAQTLDAVQRSMAAAPVDFWSVVGQTELKMYASLFGGTLEKDVSRLTEDFKEHHSRVSAPKRWASVLDTASFVLLKYKSRAKKGEAAAAGRLLEQLAELAGRKGPSSRASRSRSAKRGKRRR
jgi:hypothetical protein